MTPVSTSSLPLPPQASSSTSRPAPPRNKAPCSPSCVPPTSYLPSPPRAPIFPSTALPRGAPLVQARQSPHSHSRRRTRSSQVEEEERFGLARTRLKDDVHECFRGLRDLGVPVALLTRNNEEAVEHLVALLGDDPFAVRLSRSFEPCKPHPAPLHHIAEQLGLTADNLLMVGDSIDDVQCASGPCSIARSLVRPLLEPQGLDAAQLPSSCARSPSRLRPPPSSSSLPAAGSLGCLVGCPDSNPAFERALPAADLVAKTLTDVLTLVRTWRSDA